MFIFLSLTPLIDNLACPIIVLTVGNVGICEYIFNFSYKKPNEGEKVQGVIYMV